MKSILYILTMLLLSTGCGSKLSDEPSAAELSADKTVLEFTAEGGVQTFTVTTLGGFYIMDISADWVTAVKGSKDAEGKTPVSVTVMEHNLPTDRRATISVSNGKQRAHVEVIQRALGHGDSDAPLAFRLPHILGMGWNLGNQFDAHSNGVSSETAWSNSKASQSTFTKVKAAGFSTVRIPVTWLGHIGPAPDYKIEDAWLDRIAQVVGFAETAGLNAVINIHHDGSECEYWLDINTAAKDPAVHQQILEQVSAMWGQIAERFKDKGDFLLFESFNEIQDGGWGWGDNLKDGGKQYQCLHEWNQAFVNSVRATGGNNANRILVVPAYCTNVDIAIESFRMPEDSANDRLVMAVHSYDPYDYTLKAKYSEWGHTADPAAKYPGDNESDMKKMFEKIYSNFISKGIPVYMGEFGCVNRATEREQKFQQYYLKYYAKLAKTYGVASMIWDNGAKGAGEERHAFLSHANGEYCSLEAKAAIQALIGAYNDDLSLDDIYNSAPR